MSRGLWAAPVLLCAALLLSACGDMGKLQTAAPAAPPIKPNRTVAQTPASERGNPRLNVIGRQISGNVCTDADFYAQPPQTGEIRLAVGSFGSRGGEVRFAVGGARDSRRRVIQPLGRQRYGNNV